MGVHTTVTINGHPVEVVERWSPESFQFLTGGYSANREFDCIGMYSHAEAMAAVALADTTCSINQAHPYNPYLICTGRTSARPHLNVVRVIVPYQSTPAGWHPDPGAPLDDPVRYIWEPLVFSEAVDRTSEGNLIVNAAFEPLSGNIQGEFHGGRMTALRNEPYFNHAIAMDFQNSVNNAMASFKQGQWNLDLGQSKVCTISPATEMTRYSPFVAVRYVVDFKPGFIKDSDGYWDGFKRRDMNHGRRGWYIGLGGQVRRGDFVKTSNAGLEPAGQDVLLDATGIPLQPEWKVRKLTEIDGLGAEEPTECPYPMPSDIIIENSPYGATGGDVIATFLKYFPQGIKKRNHNDLGL